MKTEQTPTPNKEPIIALDSLMISFGTHEVLKKVSLKLYEGENLVILGKSGCGKSVLIKCIVRLLVPDQGNIHVLGEEVGSLSDAKLDILRKKIGFLFQQGALYDSMTVRENLEFPLRRMCRELTAQQITDKVLEALHHVGLPDTVDKMPSELSGGMRKRISLARTVIVEPLIVLYDEPTTGLDPVTSDEISNLINDSQKKYKTSSIIITHDIACARLTADRVVFLVDGNVYHEGLFTSFENSDDPVIKAFFK